MNTEYVCDYLQARAGIVRAAHSPIALVLQCSLPSHRVFEFFIPAPDGLKRPINVSHGYAHRSGCSSDHSS